MQPEVWMLGPVPPPVTGMTLLTEAVVRAVQQAGPAHFLNWSPGMSRRSLRMRLMRNWRILQSLARLTLHGRVDDGHLYLVANARSGLYITALAAVIGRALGYTIYLHHHVYPYLDSYDWRMAWIDRIVGAEGFHVVHAEKMAEDFRRQYRTSSSFLYVYPSIVVTAIGQPRESFHQPFRLGLLSSLSLEKGVDVAIDTLRSLRSAGREVTLTLAGPIPSGKEKQLIDRSLLDNPNHLQYVGPLYGDEKVRFLADIDAFILPTMTESWGLVLNEALAAGVPVITYDRGCTATVVGSTAGLVIPPQSSFVEQAAAQIEHWVDDRQAYRQASHAAVAQAEHLRAAGQRTLAAFIERIFSYTDDTVN